MDGAFTTSSGLDALVQPDRAHTTMYTDRAIFEAEMTKVFENTWVWVAHESEVPEPGDFKTALVGLQPVIVVRDREGAVRVHVNRCRHRAATLCEINKGKTSSFVCPYHGWNYGLDGALRGVPYADGYGDDLDKTQFPLISLRVEIYAGMIFATFKTDMQPLVDFLGGAKKWIDLFMKQGGGYPIKVLGEHKFRFPGNWKIQLENTTDAYHFPLVHRSFLVAADNETGQMLDMMNNGGFVEDLGNGHSVLVMIPDLVDLDENLEAPIPKRFQGLATELAEDYSDAEVRRIVRAVGGSGFNLNLFPNVACSMAFFRVLQPFDVGETEIRHVAIGMNGGPAAANRARIRMHEFFQGPMGFGSPDDAEVWDRVQRGAQGGRDLWIMLNRGLANEEGLPDGHRRSDVSSETGMRAAYQQWKRMMEALMDMSVTSASIGLAEAMEFVWLEADLLDAGDYDAWLALWAPDARYVVPIDPAVTDFENALNYAYDDHALREKRVARLVNGYSISASPVARTIRLLSRFRLLHASDTSCELRCAQMITEFRRKRERTYAADLTFRLVQGPGGLLIEQKVVRLINSTEALSGIGYIL